jgi:hypothetical protein
MKVYLAMSAFISELELNFTEESLENESWNYVVKKKDRNVGVKADVYWINEQGNYLEAQISKDNHPNLLRNFAGETDNGVLIRLQAKSTNYKEGVLFMCYQDRAYMVDKMLKTLQEKQCGCRNWVNFYDLSSIQKDHLNQCQNEKTSNFRK